MPTYLTSLARAEWRRLVPMLLNMKTLRISDGNALAGLCCAHAQFVMAQREIAARGIMLDIYEICEVSPHFPKKGKSGKPIAVLLSTKKNPAIQIASDADRRLRSYYAAFGLDPVSHSKLIASGTEPPDDPLDAFLEDSDAGKTVN